jgi:quinol monooxygenase YgiN
MALVVTATWKARPGQENQVREIIKIMTSLSRQERANRQYQGQVSPDDPGTFFLYEMYDDEAGFEEHKASEHFRDHVLGDAVARLEHRAVKTFTTIDV